MSVEGISTHPSTLHIFVDFSTLPQLTHCCKQVKDRGVMYELEGQARNRGL